MENKRIVRSSKRNAEVQEQQVMQGTTTASERQRATLEPKGYGWHWDAWESELVSKGGGKEVGLFSGVVGPGAVGGFE